MIVHKPENHALVREKGAQLLGAALLGDPATAIQEVRDGWVFEVRAEAVLDGIDKLRRDSLLGFTYFIDITAVDYATYPDPKPGRFSVVYTLLSPVLGVRIQLVTYLPEENPVIASLTPLFAGANWCEREVYDMYGIEFRGHPALKRILMPEEYEGHPLRKDYPLRGRGERASFTVYTSTRGHNRNL